MDIVTQGQKEIHTVSPFQGQNPLCQSLPGFPQDEAMSGSAFCSFPLRVPGIIMTTNSYRYSLLVKCYCFFTNR